MSQKNVMSDTVYDVFISYSSKDKRVTDALCHFLEEKKIRCWFAPRDILPGQEYAEAIVQAMNSVKVFVLVYSSDALQSTWVHKETNLAVSDEKVIIPFKIENCSFEGTGMKLYLNDRHWIDAVPNPDEAFGDLAKAITSLIGSKTSTETTPPQVQPEEPKKPYQIPPSAGEDSAIAAFLDQAEPILLERFFAAKSKERFFWISGLISMVLFFILMGNNYKYSGTLMFLYFLISIPCGLFFTIKAFFYSRKLACSFKYSVLKKAYKARQAAAKKTS